MTPAPGGKRARRGRDRWLAIELRHLAALATVAQEASFSAAADSLGYGQSAISHQIAHLERIVGRRLVERAGRPRSVRPTAAGAVLLERVAQILGELRLAKEEIDACTRPDARPIGVGMAAIFGSWLPAAVLAELLPDAGGAGWGRVEQGPGVRLLDAVAAGELDAAFVELPIAAGPFSAIELLREPCVLALPRAVSSGNGAPRGSAAACEPHGAAAAVEAALRRWPLVAIEDCRATQSLLPRGSAPHSADSPASALGLVRAGAAAAVVTRRDLPAGSHWLPLPGVPERVLGLAWHRDRDGCPAIASLRAAARRAFASPA